MVSLLGQKFHHSNSIETEILIALKRNRTLLLFYRRFVEAPLVSVRTGAIRRPIQGPLLMEHPFTNR